MKPWTIRGCVSLGALLGVAMTQWPYSNSCGWGLAFYASSVGVVLIAGIWGLTLTWKGRLGFTHIIALATLIWGAALTAYVVAPRVGYAARPATWQCVG